MAPDDPRIAALAKALAHPARLRIVRHLRATPGCIGGDIGEAAGLAQSTGSRDLRILESAGVITGRIDSLRVRHALSPAPQGVRIDCLTPPEGPGRLIAEREPS
jgi:ArsR family transcriptional regulator